MFSKTLLLSLLTSASASVLPRQTTSQSLEIENFSINADTGSGTTIYSLSVERGNEAALCQIQINAAPTNDGCYDTPTIYGFETEACNDPNFSWSIVPYGTGNFGLTLNALTDDESIETELTACYSIEQSEFTCLASERNTFGPTSLTLVASAGERCAF